jgi:hypothetical protein
MIMDEENKYARPVAYLSRGMTFGVSHVSEISIFYFVHSAKRYQGLYL